MVKSMVEHLASTHKLDLPRKQRFPERFLEDVTRLVNLVTTEILTRQRIDGKDSKVENLSHLKFYLTHSNLNGSLPVQFTQHIFPPKTWLDKT